MLHYFFFFLETETGFTILLPNVFQPPATSNLMRFQQQWVHIVWMSLYFQPRNKKCQLLTVIFPLGAVRLCCHLV